MWVYPDAAKVGTARQVVVMDTIALRKAWRSRPTAAGRQIFDGHANDTAIGGPVSVTGNQWYHVMQHVYPTDDPGAPSVDPENGLLDLGFMRRRVRQWHRRVRFQRAPPNHLIWPTGPAWAN